MGANRAPQRRTGDRPPRRTQSAGGHWHHVELIVDQMFMLRPLYGAAQYDTPVAGFYLCGAGTHPGGDLMGTAGRNAARRVLELEKKS